MSIYCHSKTYETRYSDFDFKDELRFSSLLGVTQESACMSADELGFGYDDLRPQSLGFIIVNSYCKLNRPVQLGEALTVETWPLPPRHVFFERDYRLFVGQEEVAAVASRWCLVDLNNFSLLTPERLGEAHARCPYRAEKTTEPPSWKIPRIRNAREMYRMIVGNSHCDHYLHANNARYADFFFDCFTVDELSDLEVSAFQIAYLKQAKEGTELLLVREDIGDGALCEVRCGGETLSQFRVWFRKKGEQT